MKTETHRLTPKQCRITIGYLAAIFAAALAATIALLTQSGKL